MDMKDIELTQAQCEAKQVQDEKQKKKATKTDWFRNGVRNDLNTLIAQNTKIIEKVDWLTKEIVKLKPSSEVPR